MVTTAPAWPKIKALEKFKASGLNQWRACCPAHHDRNPSLSIGLGDDGKILLKCQAGCDDKEIVHAIGCEESDLFPPRKGGAGYSISQNTPATLQPPPLQAGNDAASVVVEADATVCNPATAPGEPEALPRGCTLAQYANLKGLPVGFLRDRFALSEMSYQGAPAVRIPYYAVDTKVLLATRYRTALTKAKDAPDNRFRWKSGNQATVYGQWLLEAIRQRGEVLLVEGESDTHTGWYHDVPTLGVPGASIFSDKLLAPLLEGLATIYVIIEPDRGGETVRKWLEKSKLRERVRVIDLAAQTGHKDLSALHMAVNASREAFAAAWTQATASARLWTEIAAHERQRETSAAWSACETLAKKLDILSAFADQLASAGVAGETRNAKLLYLAVTSRFLDRPISLIMKGPSSAGKSYTTERVLAYFPESAWYALSGVSEKTLVYSEEPISHRFLVFYEAAGLSSDFATYILRSLLSEGKIRYETTEKTPEGSLKARMIERDGPTGAIITTTAVALHPENETRMLSLYVSDTQEQTKAVLRAQACERTAEPDYTPWHALQEWLESAEHRVTIPYAAQLAEAIPPLAVRLRRDFTQILNLIRAHAILHQASRARDSVGRIVATPADYAAIRELVYDLIAEGVEASVSQTVRDTVKAVSEHADGNGAGLTVANVGHALKLDKSAAWRRVQTCIKRGYLKNLEDRKGQPARIVIGDQLPEDIAILPTPEGLAEAVARLQTVATGYATTPAPMNSDTVGGAVAGLQVYLTDRHTPAPPTTGRGVRYDALKLAEWRGWAAFSEVTEHGQAAWESYLKEAPLAKVAQLVSALRSQAPTLS